MIIQNVKKEINLPKSLPLRLANGIQIIKIKAQRLSLRQKTYIQESISAMAIMAKIRILIGGFLTSANCVLWQWLHQTML